MLRRMLIAGLLFVSVAPAHAGPDAPAASPLEVKIPNGAPVTLDGIVLPGEWTEAARCPTSAGGPEIRMIQDRGTWILAIGTSVPWPTNGRLTIYARPGNEAGEIRSKGTVWIDLEPREHNRPHALVRVRNEAGDAWIEKPGEVVVRFADVAHHAALEAAIPLSLLGIAKRDAPALRWMAILTSPGTEVNYRTFPRTLDLAGPDKMQIGPDLLTTEGWALTKEWPKADGPGAYSPKEWSALVDADKDLTLRGTTAHATALALDGATVDDKKTERQKVDLPVERDLLENLRAIARIEPLNRTDVRAMARGMIELNDAPSAVAMLESAALLRDGPPEADDLELLARAALACERFEVAARAYEAMAERVVPRLAPGFLGTAKWVRSIRDDSIDEMRARAEDARKDDLPLARLRTSKGDVFLRLLENDVPEAVNQFVYLAETAKSESGAPFYEGTRFHYVTAGFLAQGGDPGSRTNDCTAVGLGGSEWAIAPEVNARHRCFRGAVGFALNGTPDVRSQFFIMTGPKPDYHKTGMPIFATVVAGMDVVDRLEFCDKILGIQIWNKRSHPYVPKKKT